MRAPTEKQYDTLIALGGGNAGLSMRRRTVDPLLKHGWVSAEWHDPYYQWVRITPEGLRALALAVEKFGLPTIGPKPRTTVRVCSDCGSTRYHHRSKPVEEVIAA